MIATHPIDSTFLARAVARAFSVLVATSTLSALVAARAPMPAPQSPPLDGAAGVLLEAGPHLQRGPESTSRDLAALGPAAIPELFELLKDGSMPRPGGRPGRISLSPQQREALLGAFELLPLAQVRAHVSRVDPFGATQGERITALEVLGAVGDEMDVETMVTLTHPAVEPKLAPHTMRSALERELGALLARVPRGLQAVPSAYSDAHPSLLLPLVDAIGAEASADRLETLTRILGREPAADGLILTAIGRQGASLPHPIEGRAGADVRGYFFDDDVNLRIEAATAAGRLEDYESVPALIDLLGDPDANVVRAAHESLKSIAGIDRPADVERWRTWYQAQMDWWRYEAQEDFQMVRNGSPAGAAHVVLELSKRRFFRHELTEPIAPALQRKDGDLGILACAALGHLGSHTAVPHLIEALERGDVDLQSASWRALQRITGLSIGPDPGAWRDATR
jgi:HEAT repeat protein